MGNNEIGRKFFGEGGLEVDLGTGTMKAFFQSFGKEQEEIEELKIKERGRAIEIASSIVEHLSRNIVRTRSGI